MLSFLIEGFAGLMASGGFAMPPLVGCAAMLWYALGLRMLTLRRGATRSIRDLVAARKRLSDDQAPATVGLIDTAVDVGVRAQRQYRGRVPPSVLEEIFSPIRADLEWGRVIIRSIVAISPLLGLLGTVTGMIETFRSLADMALFTQGGGIAGGIAEALLTTQMGLAVSVPGIIVGRMLDRRQQRLESELDQLEELLSAGNELKEAA